MEFWLSEEEFLKMKEQNCYYCKKENSKTHQNGIDIKDNNIGYSIDNVVTCCRECNQMKSNLSDTFFIEHCKSVSQFYRETKIEILLLRFVKIQYVNVIQFW